MPSSDHYSCLLFIRCLIPSESAREVLERAHLLRILKIVIHIKIFGNAVQKYQSQETNFVKENVIFHLPIHNNNYSSLICKIKTVRRKTLKIMNDPCLHGRRGGANCTSEKMGQSDL